LTAARWRAHTDARFARAAPSFERDVDLLADDRPGVLAGTRVTDTPHERYERVAKQAQAAAAQAEARASAARQRGEAAAARAHELRHEPEHMIHRRAEAAARLASAEATAATARRLALLEYERAAFAHEEDARTHERVAVLMEETGDTERASIHLLQAARARAAARDARRIAAADGSKVHTSRADPGPVVRGLGG
jgi:hypothetical protein